MEYNLFDPFPRHVEAILIAELEKDLLYPLDPNIVFGVHAVEIWPSPDRLLSRRCNLDSPLLRLNASKHSHPKPDDFHTSEGGNFLPKQDALPGGAELYRQQCSQEDVLTFLPMSATTLCTS